MITCKFVGQNKKNEIANLRLKSKYASYVYQRLTNLNNNKTINGISVNSIGNLPKPKCALTPPKFLTRNNDDFLKLQLIIKPNSDSSTHVPCNTPKKKEDKNKNKIQFDDFH